MAKTARSRCRWCVSGGRACGTVRECHRLVDGASERFVGARDCSAVRVSAAAAAQIVVQPVVWQQANGHAQLAAGAIETGRAAGEGVLGLARGVAQTTASTARVQAGDCELSACSSFAPSFFGAGVRGTGRTGGSVWLAARALRLGVAWSTLRMLRPDKRRRVRRRAQNCQHARGSHRGWQQWSGSHGASRSGTCAGLRRRSSARGAIGRCSLRATTGGQAASSFRSGMLLVTLRVHRTARAAHRYFLYWESQRARSGCAGPAAPRRPLPPRPCTRRSASGMMVAPRGALAPLRGSPLTLGHMAGSFAPS